MQRRSTRLAVRLALTSALLLTLVIPGAALAADPSSGADATASASSSDQVISVDPTFITATATPRGAVLSSTGRPQRTLPPTDAVGGSSSTSAPAQGLPLLLLVLATICLAAARLPEVRRR